MRTLPADATKSHTNTYVNTVHREMCPDAKAAPYSAAKPVALARIEVSPMRARLMRFRPSANISVFTPMPMRK